MALIGPRQCGKTTLARQIVPPDSLNYFDLEDPADLARLNEPKTTLAPLHGTVVIDEIQRQPGLFPLLRVLADRKPLPARFLILGSASPGLVRESSETLAGRIETITLGGFSLEELGADAMTTHWRRGGFPPAFLAASEEDSGAWRSSFLQTLVERDIPQLGLNVPPTTLLRFWPARSLSRRHLACGRACQVSRCKRADRPAIPRPPVGPLHDAAASTVA